jgi:hypothetical protein
MLNSSKIVLSIESKEPFCKNECFGDVGQYELLKGRVYYKIDPQNSMNRNIVDLGYCLKDDFGFVEYSADFCILKPVDMKAGNQCLLYDVLNRGNKRILQFFNDGIKSNDPNLIEHAGNGFLMRRGYTILWSGWQGDLLSGDGRMTMELPIPLEDGKEVSGIVRIELIFLEEGIKSHSLCTNDGRKNGNNYTKYYESVTLENTDSQLTFRENEWDRRTNIPSNEWKFATISDDGEIMPSTKHITLLSGFHSGWIYELIYRAKNPMVLGLGFTGVRDLVSFLRYEAFDEKNNPNPLKIDEVEIEKAYAWGRSQSGRFLRDFVYQGFNENLNQRRVFDAIFPHVSGAGRIYLNYRFAQPGCYSRQHENHLYPSDGFPFAYLITTDPLTGKTDGILKRPHSDPYVFHTQTSSEYWQRRGSLVHTDSIGNDLDDHEKVRIFLFASSQHGADPNSKPEKGIHQYSSNPLNTTPILRALLDMLDKWVRKGIAPINSRVPMSSNGTLVTVKEAKKRFPSIKGVYFPEKPNQLFVTDYGKEYVNGLISKEPPEIAFDKEYCVKVPNIDVDGNEVPGIRTPHIEAPLATYTGWNFWSTKIENRVLYSVIGCYFPFKRTKEKKCMDQRSSVEERYSSSLEYINAISKAAQNLMNKRLLLKEDYERYLELAQKDTDIWAELAR